MAEQLLTKCPHCGTTFRLTQQHLQVAGGAVRCGACYQVFHAGEYLVKAAQPAGAVSSPQRPSNASSDEFSLGDMEGLHANDDLDFDLDIGGADDHTSPPASSKRSEDSEDWARELLASLGETLDDEDDDEDLQRHPGGRTVSRAGNTRFNNIHSDKEVFSQPDPLAPLPVTHQHRAERPKPPDDEFSDSFRNLEDKGVSNDPFHAHHGGDDIERIAGDTDESWAKTMLEELAPPQKAQERITALPQNTAMPMTEKRHTSPRDESLRDSEANTLEIRDFDFSSPDIDLNILDDTPIPAAMRPSSDVTERIRARAAQLAEEEEPVAGPSRFKAWLLGIAIVALLMALTAHFAYFKFDEYARWSQLRPYYAVACEKLGCMLPSLTDTTKIHGKNLVVRSHPRHANALSVDFMMSNEASYTQPFPIIELTFEDLDGGLVASRGFAPEEYLNDNSIDPKKMKPHTPYRIGLEIVDPGPKAANYRLRYLSAQE